MTLFDGYEPPPCPTPDGLSVDRRRTIRREHELAAGVHPTTRARLLPAEAGLRCDDCAHCQTLGHHDQTYVKCTAVPLTHGPGTDTRRKWPACTRFEAKK